MIPRTDSSLPLRSGCDGADNETIAYVAPQQGDIYARDTRKHRLSTADRVSSNENADTFNNHSEHPNKKLKRDSLAMIEETKDIFNWTASCLSSIPPSALELFPHLTAYLQEQHQQKQSSSQGKNSSSPSLLLTRQTVMGLRYLASHFQVDSLKNETWNFIKQDLANSNNPVADEDVLYHYLTEAQQFKDDQTAKWVAFECAQRIMSLKPTSKVLLNLSPNDFEHVLVLAQNCQCIKSPTLASELVASYCSQRINDISYGWFHKLTCKQMLPQIAITQAFRLIEIEMVLRKAVTHGQPNTMPIVEHANEVLSTPLSCLQRRCVQTLAKNQQ